MSFRDLQETAQCAALAEKLLPDETSIWKSLCREYSKLFHTELEKVYSLDPLHVLTEVYSDQLSGWDMSERMEDLKDLIGSLSDPAYNIEKERTLREETRQMVEEEKRRLAAGEAVHKSLEKDKLKFAKEEDGKKLPKSGGINMALVNQLKNEEKECGEF